MLYLAVRFLFIEKLKNKINIFDSISKAEEAQIKYASEQSPIERIKETVELILRVYSTEPKKPNTNRIYFDKE